MSAPRADAEVSADLDRRMGAIEDYMATSDEYIIEAARQAAEAVVDAYSRNGGSAGRCACSRRHVGSGSRLPKICAISKI